MMHPSCNNNTSTNYLYDPSRVLEDYYYYYSSSPSLFPSSPSLHHPYLQGDGANNIEADFFQDLLENHHEIMIQQHQNPVENYNSNTNNNTNDNNDKSKRVGIEKISSPRKKVSKKDRHSKIETAKGPRDRRMRLSLNIARRFFDLQDMLGFDKASKTVEWLLTKSISAITELSTSIQHQVCANSSLSSTSEIVMDELSSSTNNNGNLEKGMLNIKNSEPKKPNKKVVRTIRPLNKKSREKARERARERTKEKLQKRRELEDVVGHGSSLQPSASWIHASTFPNLQQNDGLIHGLTSPELEPLSGNLGEASIW